MDLKSATRRECLEFQTLCPTYRWVEILCLHIHNYVTVFKIFWFKFNVWHASLPMIWVLNVYRSYLVLSLLISDDLTVSDYLLVIILIKSTWLNFSVWCLSHFWFSLIISVSAEIFMCKFFNRILFYPMHNGLFSWCLMISVLTIH